MPICTATDVTVFTDISASAGTIVASGLIPVVQSRINDICNNYFLTDMYIQSSMTFDATAGTIVTAGDFEVCGFIDGDEIYISNSYRNDGYKTIDTVVTDTITISSSDSVIVEALQRPILIAVVKWPDAIKYIAAQMVKYDYDDRPGRTIGVNSETLGPYSVSYGTSGFNPTPYGYPIELINSLSAYTNVRIE